MRRRYFLLIAWILAAAGCARRETDVDAGIRDQVLLVGNKDEPSDLDPTINNASSTGFLLTTLFEGLVSQASDGVSIIPGAAERWEVSPDGLTLTFHLRKSGRWSNGAPLTSKDFYDSFFRALDPQVASENAGNGFPIRGARDYVEGRSRDPATVGISAPDPYTFVLTLEHPAPYMFSLLTGSTFYPVYMPSLDANGGRRQRGGPWERPGVLVGNGPFVLSEWKLNAYVSVKRNPFYWDAARVRLNEIRFFPTDDEDAEERAFRAGQLHITARIPQSKVAVYEAGHPDELHVNPIFRTNYITFNVARAPFTDPRVRAAFSLAIDRKELVKAALGKLGTPAFSYVRPGTGGFVPKKGFRFDPQEGRRLLAEAGFPGGAGLPPIEFSLNGNGGTALQVGEVLQQMWAQNLGAHVTVQPMEFKVYLTLLREKNFQVVLDGWFSFPDPSNILELGVIGDPNNDSGGGDPEYDAAYAAAEHTLDPSGRRAAFDRMEAANAREVMYAPIYFTNRGYLVHPGVRGLKDNPTDTVDWREVYLAP
jgi:oligopeptide transport system substrate-binding protein